MATKWQQENKEKWYAWKRVYHQNNREKQLVAMRRRYLKRTYKITPEEYDRMLLEQNGVCAICLRPNETKFKYLAVDHNHSTGAIRGLLCSNCNLAIGLLKDDPLRARALASYLESRNGASN
jgi:hypothetical protein